MSDLSKIKILHIDSNHPLLWEQLENAGFTNEADLKLIKRSSIKPKIYNLLHELVQVWKASIVTMLKVKTSSL